MPLLKGLCQQAAWTGSPLPPTPGAPYQIPSPGCCLSQGLSGSFVVRLRETLPSPVMSFGTEGIS